MMGKGIGNGLGGLGIKSLKLGTLETAWERIPGGKLTADMAASPNKKKEESNDPTSKTAALKRD